METVDGLHEETIDKLQDLIRINRDSARGCREAAEILDEGPIRDFFAALGEERAIQARVLGGFVRLNDEEPEDEGSLGAALHRYWMSLRATLSGRDPAAVLAEAERGEKRLKRLYEEVLVETAGSPVNDVLQRQYLQSKTGLKRVQELYQIAAEG